MKYITAFFMAWGNFCTLPCPLKLWDGKYKRIMLGFLPSVGLVIGLVWAAVLFLLVWLGLPFLLVGFAVTFIPFALCGFMHLDGFMDCSDAILSRRPLEDRQRILKDSHTGAFAVVSVVFLLLAFYSCISTAITTGIDFVNLALIAIISRSVSGLEVLMSRPMGTSQYASSDQEESAKKEGIMLVFIQLLIFLILGFWCSSYYTGTAIVCGAVAIVTVIAASYGKKQLGGMSGDIAGYSIVWGELAGVLCLSVI